MAHELILIVEDNPKNLKLVRDTLQVKRRSNIKALPHRVCPLRPSARTAGPA
jgi:CheY-like chemotaxis protein